MKEVHIYHSPTAMQFPHKTEKGVEEVVWESWRGENIGSCGESG